MTLPATTAAEPTAEPCLSAKGRYRFFPGWTMIGIAGAAQFMSAPGQSYSVAAFKEPMRSGLGISETDYSLAYGFATLLSAASMPMVGRLLDRHGARILLPIIAVLLGFACLGMSMAGSLIGVYVGFSMVRCLGQGALTMTALWLVGEWFAKRRGFATAVAGLGSSISVMSFPLLNNALISEFGWENAWAIIGVSVWIVLLPPALLVLRDRPEDLNLNPDGLPDDSEDLDDSDADGSAAVVDKHSPTTDCWTVHEVLRNATFWKLLVVPFTSGMIGTGLVFHQVAVLGSRGVAVEWALGLIVVQASVGTSLSFVAGWLTDRVEARFLMTGAMAALAMAVAMILKMPSPEFAVVYAVLMGIHGAVLRSTAMVVWINYYGRTHQGAIRGVSFSMMIFASALGPLPMALSADYLGSWDPSLTVFLFIPLISAVLVWTARRPIRPGSLRGGAIAEVE